MLTSVSFLLVFLFGLNFKKRKNTVEAKFVPVIRWNLVPKVLSLTLSRLAPEPPVTVAVLFLRQPGHRQPRGRGGAWVSAAVARPSEPGRHPARRPVSRPCSRRSGLGPCPASRGLRASCRSFPLDSPREKRKKNRTCMFRRISTIFILSLAPPPFLYALTAPRSSQNRASKL